MTPSFYHLYPSLLAVANAVGGLSLSFHVNALLGALSVTVFATLVFLLSPELRRLPAIESGRPERPAAS